MSGGLRLRQQLAASRVDRRRGWLYGLATTMTG